MTSKKALYKAPVDVCRLDQFRSEEKRKQLEKTRMASEEKSYQNL